MSGGSNDATAEGPIPVLSEIQTQHGPQRAFVAGCWAWVPTTTRLVHVPTGRGGMSFPRHLGLGVLAAMAAKVPDWDGEQAGFEAVAAAWNEIDARIRYGDEPFPSQSTDVLPIYRSFTVELTFEITVAAIQPAHAERAVRALIDDEVGWLTCEVRENKPGQASRPVEAVVLDGELVPAVDGIEVRNEPPETSP